MSPATIQYLLPEVILTAVATLIYVGGAFVPRGNWYRTLALVGFALAAIVLLDSGPADAGGMLATDALSLYVRWFVLVVGTLFVLFADPPIAGRDGPELVGSVVLITVGLSLVGTSNDLVLLFAGLELVSIPTYVLLSAAQRDPTAQEVATKYFLLSVLSSAVLLYGFSFLYGVGGSTRLSEITTRWVEQSNNGGGMRELAALAIVLVFAGLGFRLSLVPFHFYAPDVYQGTTHSNAGLLSVAPKIAGLVALVRLTIGTMPGLESYGWGLSVVLSVMTMTLGNVLALWQDNIRRLMAYSSIAHGGYILIGLAVAFAAAGGAETSAAFDGVGSALFYLTVYAVATTGTFAALHYLGSNDRPIEGVDDLAGLARQNKLAAAAIAIFMFSLAGIPPLAGFWGKLNLLASALAIRDGQIQTPLQAWFVGLTITAVLNAAIAAAYYLRIVAVMYFRAPLATVKPEGGAGSWVAMVASAVVVLIVGIAPGALVRQSNLANPLLEREIAAIGGHTEGPADSQAGAKTEVGGSNVTATNGILTNSAMAVANTDDVTSKATASLSAPGRHQASP